MTYRILAPLIFFLLLFVAYFGYREWTDPVIFNFSPAESTDEEESVSERDLSKAELSLPEPEPKPEPAPEPELNPEVIESVRESVEEEFDETYILLARVMERRLESAEQNLGERFGAREDAIQSVNAIIAEAIGGYREASSRSSDEIADIFSLISAMNNEADEVESTLENARAGWSELFEEVSSITSLSSERLDAGNYDFRTYPVGPSQTLSEVVTDLQQRYDLPASDLTYLLNRFNELDYRLVTPGGRRAPYRVVANETLSVPIPKTAGDLIGERGLPEKLNTQIATIETLTQKNAAIRADLRKQVGKLREVEGSLKAIRALTGTLEEIDLETVSGTENLISEEVQDPELRAPWEAFQEASLAYRNASDSENLRIARESLDAAIRRLLEAYESRYVEDGVESDGDPLEDYLRFIEKFSPRE